MTGDRCEFKSSVKILFLVSTNVLFLLNHFFQKFEVDQRELSVLVDARVVGLDISVDVAFAVEFFDLFNHFTGHHEYILYLDLFSVKKFEEILSDVNLNGQAFGLGLHGVEDLWSELVLGVGATNSPLVSQCVKLLDVIKFNKNLFLRLSVIAGIDLTAVHSQIPSKLDPFWTCLAKSRYWLLHGLESHHGSSPCTLGWCTVPSLLAWLLDTSSPV